MTENKAVPASIISEATRLKLISRYPLFSSLSKSDLAELAAAMQEVRFKAKDNIVKEYEFVDGFFFIVEGQAEVSQNNKEAELALHPTFITILSAGDVIGMSSTGIFSPDGRRTASVMALDEMLLLRLDIESFHSFLKKHPSFDKKMIELTELMVKIDFVNQVYPFSQLKKDEIYAFLPHIREVTKPPNTIIFNQHDRADCCYLLRSGQVEIFLPANNVDTEKKLALLEPPQLFGEAALLTACSRNASARTTTESHLFILDEVLLKKLLETSPSFSQSLMGFMVNRFRPLRDDKVIVHYRKTQDNRDIIILEHTELEKYFHLTNESYFIWQQLDGVQTIHDLTITFYRQYKAIIPEIICNLLYNLAQAGFVNIPTISEHSVKASQKTVKERFDLLKKIGSFEYVFTNTDAFLTKIYQQGIWLFYTPVVRACLFAFIILGFIFFLQSYQTVKLLSPHFLIFVVFFIPLSIFITLFHELGHTFTAKHLGYKIKRMGVGWFGLQPVMFVDTSALWIAKQQDRAAVDAAGIYVDLISAGLLAMIAYFFSHNAFAIYCWLASLLVYFNAFKNLSVIQEYDGYFLLADVLDDPHLRKGAFDWFITDLPYIIRGKVSIREHKAPLFYWLALLTYISLFTLLIFLITYIFLHLFVGNAVWGISIKVISLSLAGFSFFLSFFRLALDLARYHSFRAQ